MTSIMADEDTETALEPLHNTNENHSHSTTNRNQHICKGICLCTLDEIALLVIITTSVIFFWRGTWYIMDTVVNPHNFEASGWLSFVLGFLVIIVMHMWQSTFQRFVGKNHPVVWNIISRVHTYILAFGCVNQWRGVWYIWDNYTGDGLISGLVSTLTAICLLWMLRASRNILRTPSILLFDCDHRFTIVTRFRVDISTDVYLYILDLIFTVIMLGSAVVSYWRGMWTCLDNVLYPTNNKLSGWASLAIGYGIVLSSFMIQFIAAEVSRRLKKYSRIIFEDIFLYIVAFGILNIWRGVWYLSDEYIMPGKIWESGWITHCIGTVIVFAMGVGRSLLVIGCTIDGECTDGRGVLYPHYIRRQGKAQSPYQEDDSVTVDMDSQEITSEVTSEIVFNEVEQDGRVEPRRSSHLHRNHSPWWQSHFKQWYL